MKTISREGRARGAADKMLFVVAVVAGTAAIVGLKLAGVEQLFITVPPVVIIVLYAVVVATVKRFRLREDQAGDNCYYLGFLYTLVSLALALILFVRGERDVDSLIGNFGIALFTTIAGLAARVILGQFREDPLEVEREVRIELSEAVARFKGALDNAVTDLEAFRRANEQSIEDAVQTMLERQSAFFEDHTQKFSETTSDALTRLTETSGTFADEAAAFNTSARKLATALGGLEARIADINVPTDLLERELQPLRQAIDSLADALAQRAEAETMQVGSLDALVERLQKGGEMLATKASEFVRMLQVVPESASRLNTELSTAARTVAEHAETLAAMMTSERSEREHLAHEVREMAALLATYRKTVAAAHAEETLDARRRREDREKLHGESIALLREHNATLSAQLKETRTLMRRFEEGLIEVADEITRRVDGAAIGGG
jgi:hypothetical protein